MANIAKRYNRALGIAEFIAEGHGIEETKEEFGVSKDIISRDLTFLAGQGYGKELERNQKLYKKAKLQLKSSKKPVVTN